MVIKRHQSSDDLPMVFSVTEIAEILGVGRNLAYSLVRDGSIRSVRARSRIIIPRDALMEYLNGPVA